MFYSVYDILVKRIDDIDKDKKLINESVCEIMLILRISFELFLRKTRKKFGE